MFFFVKSTSTDPTALFPVSVVQIVMSGFNVCRGASAGISPSGKTISIGSGGLRMNRVPPGIYGTQYGSGCVFSYSSAFASWILILKEWRQQSHLASRMTRRRRGRLETKINFAAFAPENKRTIDQVRQRTFNKRTALAFEQPRSASNRLRSAIASSMKISLSMVQLQSVLRAFRYSLATLGEGVMSELRGVINSEKL